MKRHLPFRFIATLGIVCQLSAGLFDNLSTLLQQLSASIVALSNELPAPLKPDSFAIPKFDKSAIIAVGDPAEFSGIPVTQLKVFDQAASGGDASCGYQALKNVMVLMSGILAGKSGAAISQQLQDKNLADFLFRKASDTPPVEPGEWRNEFLKNNVMKNLIAAYIKIKTSDIIQTKALQEKLGRLPTPQEESNEKDILTDLGNELTEVRATIRREIFDVYEEHLKNPSKPSSFSRKYTLDDFKKIRPLLGHAMGYIDPNFTTEIAVDFTSPHRLGLAYTDFREQEKTKALESFYKKLGEKTGNSQKDLENVAKKKIIDDFIENLKKSGRTKDATLLYALSTKSKELGNIYEKINLEIPQSIDITGDWLNENQIKSLIPIAKKRFPTLNASIIPLEDTNTHEGIETINKIVQTLRNSEPSIVGIVLGAQDFQNPERSSGHWIGLVVTKRDSSYHIFIVDSLSNTNRINPAPAHSEFGDVSSEIFNERIKKIAQAIASA